MCQYHVCILIVTCVSLLDPYVWNVLRNGLLNCPFHISKHYFWGQVHFNVSISRMYSHCYMCFSFRPLCLKCITQWTSKLCPFHISKHYFWGQVHFNVSISRMYSHCYMCFSFRPLCLKCITQWTSKLCPFHISKHYFWGQVYTLMCQYHVCILVVTMFDFSAF